MLLGADDEGVNQFAFKFRGILDEVAIYDRPLSAAEIRAIYAAGSAGKCKGCVEPPVGLVSWWPGDGDANDLVGGNQGALQNGATFAPGFTGQAFAFDGVDDFLDLGDHPGWKFGTAEDYSWVAWFRIDQLPIAPYRAINSTGIILEKHHFGGAVTLLGFVRSDGIVGASLRDSNLKYIDLPSTTVVSPGAWYHVAVTADRNGLFSL